MYVYIYPYSAKINLLKAVLIWMVVNILITVFYENIQRLVTYEISNILIYWVAIG